MAVNPLKPLELVENFSQIFVKFIDIFHKISTTPSINERNGGELATAAINRTTVVATIFRHPHCLRQPPPTTTTLNTTNTNTPTQTNTNTNNIRTTTTTPTTTTPLPALFQSKKKRKRCGECVGCQRKDNCGECAPCRNDKSHQICKQRRCEKLTEKKVSPRVYNLLSDPTEEAWMLCGVSHRFIQVEARVTQ